MIGSFLDQKRPCNWIVSRCRVFPAIGQVSDKTRGANSDWQSSLVLGEYPKFGSKLDSGGPRRLGRYLVMGPGIDCNSAQRLRMYPVIGLPLDFRIAR